MRRNLRLCRTEKYKKMGEKHRHGLTREQGLKINKLAGYRATRRLKRNRAINKRAGLHYKKKSLGEGESRIYRCKPLAIKHKRRLRKVVLAFSAVLVAGLSYIGLGFLITKENYGVEELGNATVCYVTPADGSLPTEHTLVENVGYLNYALQNKEYWSSSMASTVHTVMDQHVYTYKKMYDGKLISADMATGASNTARQFCVTDEFVLWREAKGKIDISSMNSEWSDGTPYGHTVSRFRRYRGLPPSEFSVYILNELTVKNAEEKSVTDNGDGTYTMTLDLNVHQSGLDSAVHYYKQQMLVTGGLYDWPTFDYTRVTYVFTADWTLLEFSIHDRYTAKMGAISAGCSSESRTVFNYDEENAENTYYKDYFVSHDNVNGFVDPRPDMAPDPDAATYLSNAFGNVLTQGAVFKADFDIDGKPLEGVVYVGMDDGSFAELRAAFGNLCVYLDSENGKKSLYIKLGDDKLKVSLDAFSADGAKTLAETEETDGEESGLGAIINADELMKQLFAGEFTYDDTSASLKSTLEILGLKADLAFEFSVDDKGGVSLDHIAASLNLGGSKISARLEFGTEDDKPAQLTAAQKTQYTDVLNEGLTLGFNVGIGGKGEKFELDGAAHVELENGEFKGVSAVLGDFAIYFKDQTLYLNCGENAKYKLNLSAFGLGGSMGGIDLQKLLPQIIGGLSIGEGGIKFESGSLFGDMLRLALNIKLSGKFAVQANAELYGKQLQLGVGLGSEIEIPEPGNENDYVDLMNGELNFGVRVKVEDIVLDGVVSAVIADGKFKELRVDLAGGGIAVYYDSTDNMLYLTSGEDVKVKLPLSAFSGGNGLGGFDFSAILNQIIDNLAGAQNGLLTGLTLTIPESELMSAADITASVGLNLKGGISLYANAALSGKNIGLEISLGGASASALTEEQKAQYANIFGDVLSISGSLKLDVGATSIALDIEELTLKLDLAEADGAKKIGVEFALKSQITVNDVVLDLYVSYIDGRVTLVYGADENVFAVCLDIANGDLDKLKAALTDLYNRVILTLDEIVLNNPLAQVEDISEITALDGLLEKVGLANSAANGLDEILKMLGVEGEGKLVDKLINSLVFDASQNAVFGVRLGGLAVELFPATDTQSFAFDVSLANASMNLNLNISSVLAADSHANVECAELITADDIADMLDYLAATAELLVEKQYALDLQTTVYENNEVYMNANVVFEYIQGDGFPVEITLPEKDESGNEINGLKVSFKEDMYFHLGVGLSYNHDYAANYTVDKDGNKTYKDDLYLEIYILDANPEVETGKTAGLKNGFEATGGGLDVYFSISKFGEKAAGCAPLKVYAPVDEILTVLAAGVAVLDLPGIDVSEALKELQSVISAVAKLADDALVKAKLPYTHSQFASLGASLIPQFIGSDLSTFVVKMLDSLTVKAETEEEPKVEESEEVKQPVCGNYVKSIGIGTAESGDKAFKAVLNSAAIYGDGFEDITFEAYKNYTYTIRENEEGELVQGEPKSHITGASVNNIYFGGNRKVDLQLKVNRSVLKLEDFAGYYDLSGMSTLLEATVNSATHTKENATELDREIYGDNLTDYLLNRYYYLDGKINIHIPVVSSDYQLGVVASVNIDKNNDVTINAGLDIPAIQEVMQVVTNGKTHTELTIKNGMVYIKRVEYSYWKVTMGVIYSEKNYAEPITTYRVMPVSEFAAHTMDHIVFMLNLGPVVTDNMNGSGSNTAKPENPDYGTAVGKILKSFVSTATPNSASWALTINGGAIDFGTDAIGMSDIIITLNASSRYDANSNSNAYLLTGINIETALNLANVLNITVDGEINYCNPQQIMGKQYTDTTVDSSLKWEELFGCSSSALGVAAAGLEDDAEYSQEVLKAAERWNKALANLNTEKQYIEIISNADTGVKLGEISVYVNGEKLSAITILYGTNDGLLSVNPAAPDLGDWVGYDKQVVYSGVELNEDGTLSVNEFASPAVYFNYSPKKFTVTISSVFAQIFSEELEYVYDTDLYLAKYFDGREVEVDGVYYTIVAFELDGNYYTGNISGFNTLEDVTFNAVWDEVDTTREFEITYVAGDAVVETLTAVYGSELDLTVTPEAPQGYYFDGWDYNGLKNVYSNRVLTAVFKPITYTVTLDLSGYDCAEEAVEAGFELIGGNYIMSYTYDEVAITLQGLGEIPGFSFLNYYVLDGEEKVEISRIYNITSSLTVYPEFDDIRIHTTLTSDIAFTYNGQQAQAVVGEDGSEHYELLVHIVREESALKDGESDGYTFLGWWYYTQDESGEKTYTKLEDVLSVAYPGETIEFEIRALWGKATVQGSHSMKDVYEFPNWKRVYGMSCEAGYEFFGYSEVIEKIEQTATVYTWHMDDGAACKYNSGDTDGGNSLNYTFGEQKIKITSGAMSNWEITVTITFVLDGASGFTLAAQQTGKI